VAVAGGNPAAGTATLSFNLAEAAPVSISVYDVNGRMIRGLVDQDRLPAGDHVVSWDGRDRTGSPVPPGIYITRFQLGNLRFARKIVMTR